MHIQAMYSLGFSSIAKFKKQKLQMQGHQKFGHSKFFQSNDQIPKVADHERIWHEPLHSITGEFSIENTKPPLWRKNFGLLLS